MKKSLLAFTLVVLSFSLSAQIVEGVITDAKTREPIDQVFISGKYKKKTFGSKTGKMGHFIFEYKGKFPITLEFNHIGYETKTIEVSKDNIELNIALEPLAEGDTNEVSGKIYDFGMVESKPVFPGCKNEDNEEARFDCFQKGVMQVIIDNFNYPKKAVKNKLEGRVYVSFVISRTGDIKNVRAIKGKYKLLNDEAVRLIKLMPKMEPAIQRGKPVNMSYTVPLNFKL